MPWANPTSPNLPDFLLFIQQDMGIGPGYLPQPIGAPVAPSLTAGSGGSLPTGAVYVVITYTSQYGETVASAETNVAVTGPSGQVSVASPTTKQGATGYRVYAASAAGAEVFQGAAGIGTPFVLNSLATGAGTPPAVDTSGSPYPGYAFAQAVATVLTVPGVAGLPYTLAVYNCAGHILMDIAPDQPGQSFFQDSRKSFRLNEFSAGLVQTDSDQGTSSTLAVPDALAALTIEDLQFTKTPWGIRYLSYAQSFGGLFGLT